MTRIEAEKLTFSKMLRIYCRKVHKTPSGLCSDCQKMNEYAHIRLDKCPFGEEKPNCKHCKIHCYKPDLRVEAKRIMRIAGPHMIYQHPVLAMKHILKSGKR
jgi:hypothetical protein